MSLLEALLVLLAGLGAGAINTLVGSGTLITFPTLLAVGYPPVVANVSNCVGLVPGSLAGALGYRRELEGQSRRIVRLGAASLAGAVLGAVLLLELPEEAFAAVVPVFIAVALVLIALQGRLARTMLAHRARAAEHGAALAVLVFLTGTYGGYFGAAQGIILLAIFGIALPEDIQRANALKNVLAGLVNLVAGVVFMAVADVAWEVVALIAAGAVVGGGLGARYGRRLPPAGLRAIVVIVGLWAIAQLVL